MLYYIHNITCSQDGVPSYRSLLKSLTTFLLEGGFVLHNKYAKRGVNYIKKRYVNIDIPFTKPFNGPKNHRLLRRVERENDSYIMIKTINEGSL